MTSATDVLIVEDDVDIRDALQEILASEGYRVITAANGKLGLAALAAGPPPRLILLDLMMPVMDGLEFLALKKSDAAIAEIPVIVLSAVSDKSKVTGVKDFLRKPIELNTLLDAVASVCSPA